MFSKSKKQVDARLVGSTLVATFRNSDPNLIWKFDLERNHSFTLALQGDEGDLELGVTSPKGEFYSIARFVTREDADTAFTAVQKALMKRHCGWGKCVLKWLGILVLVAAIAISGGVYVVGRMLNLPVGHTTAPAAAPAAPEIRGGVPVPADQVLRPPPQ